jgi:hypothetical protein
VCPNSINWTSISPRDDGFVGQPPTGGASWSDIRIVNEYAYPIEKVWRALTDPELIPRWTKEGLGGRPEGFAPIAGTAFRLVAKPQPFWRGFVECEVVEVRSKTTRRDRRPQGMVKPPCRPTTS